jgi:hypothetical protein
MWIIIYKLEELSCMLVSYFSGKAHIVHKGMMLLNPLSDVEYHTNNVIM